MMTLRPYLGLPITIQLRLRLSFSSPPLWHHTVFYQMICSGFHLLFFELLFRNHFCPPCSRFFTWSHTFGRLFHGFVSIGFRGGCHFSRSFLNVLCVVPSLLPILRFFFITAFLKSIFASSFSGLHLVHFFCPPRREVIQCLEFLFHRMDRVMGPRVSHLHTVVRRSFINKVIQLRRPLLLAK